MSLQNYLPKSKRGKKKTSSKLLTANYLSSSSCQLFQTPTNILPHQNILSRSSLSNACGCCKINLRCRSMEKHHGKMGQQQLPPEPRFTSNIPMTQPPRHLSFLLGCCASALEQMTRVGSTSRCTLSTHFIPARPCPCTLWHTGLCLSAVLPTPADPGEPSQGIWLHRCLCLCALTLHKHHGQYIFLAFLHDEQPHQKGLLLGWANEAFFCIILCFQCPRDWNKL